MLATLATTLALAAASAAPPPPPPSLPPTLEVALDDGLATATVVVLDSPVAPARVDLLPEELAVASSWYRVGSRVLVVTALPRPSGRDSALRIVPRDRVARDAEPAYLRGVARAVTLPLREAIAGPVIALALGERVSLRSLLLRGDLDGALVLGGGKILTPRDDAVGERLLTLIPAGGPETAVVVAADRGRDLSLHAASLHAGYPLPSPERFRLPPGTAGEFSFEVPERSRAAELSFEAFNLVAPGQLRIDFEGTTVFESGPGGVAGGWSDPILVELPEGAFARGRPSLVTFHLRPPDATRDRLGSGLRRLGLDVPLPAAGPFGLGPHGDGDHPGEVRLSWWATEGRLHVLRFTAEDLDEPSELEVLAGSALLATAGGEGGIRDREVEVLIPSELVRPGERNSIVIRETGLPFATHDWAVSDLRVAPVPAAPVIAADPVGPSHEGEGPVQSLAPLTDPGQTPRDAESRPVAPAGLPGQGADPVGETLYFGVPVAEPVRGEPPPGVITTRSLTGVFLGPPPPPPPPASPVNWSRPSPASAASVSGSAGEALPGQTAPVRGPRVVPVVPETPRRAASGLHAPSGTLLEFTTDPPGAAVFLSPVSGYRGAFLGLTPFAMPEETQGFVHFRLVHAGYHDASIAAFLSGSGRLEVARTLLPWQGIDFARPLDPCAAAARPGAPGYAAPVPGDLDQDGRLDLVVGDELGGVSWRRDEKDAGPPRFGAPQPLKLADGRPLAVEGYAAPALADWDGDGQVDLLVGEKGGGIRFFRRGPPSRGLGFEDRGFVVADGAALAAGNDAAPLVVDWNGDSLPDLLVGSGYGIVVLFAGIGHGELTQIGPLSQDGAPVQFLLDVVPVDLSDWTGDGRADLVLATMSGQVLLYPAAAEPRGRFDFSLPRPVTIRGGLDLYVGTYPHGIAADLDGDGYRDLLFGNATGEILWLRGGEPHEFDEIEPIGRAGAAPR